MFPFFLSSVAADIPFLTTFIISCPLMRSPPLSPLLFQKDQSLLVVPVERIVRLLILLCSKDGL
jgi:hypothetical protein